jgi:succinoglycan biosynthesis protein ExoO
MMVHASVAMERDLPAVTVIVAAWNCQEFIHHAIYSALQQEGVVLEVIVVDDASTDLTSERVGALAKLDARVRLVQLATNGGPAQARNRGISEAAHDWVAVLDADDAFRPGRLRHLMMLARSSGADLVADNFVYRNVASGRVTGPALRQSAEIRQLDLYSFLDGARPFAQDVDLGLLKPVFRKQFLKQNDILYPADVRHGEDFEMVLIALTRGAKYILDPRKAFYIYTDRNSGWSRTHVDYAGQISRTISLAAQVPYVFDARAVELLNERSSALSRLENERKELQRYHSSGRIRKLALNVRSLAGWRRLARGVRDYLHLTNARLRSKLGFKRVTEADPKGTRL